MTGSSAEPYQNEARFRAERQLRSEFESGRRNIILALAAIALITLPMILFGTRDWLVTAFAVTLIAVCSVFILVRYDQAEKHAMENLDDRYE